jgi:hypothetical protein
MIMIMIEMTTMEMFIHGHVLVCLHWYIYKELSYIICCTMKSMGVCDFILLIIINIMHISHVSSHCREESLKRLYLKSRNHNPQH